MKIPSPPLLVTAAACLVALLAVGPAWASGGSPFNGHYTGTSANGRHHVDVNVNGGAVLTTGLQLRCADGRRAFADFEYRARITGSRFEAVAHGRGRSRGAELEIEGKAVANGLKGRFTATVGPCEVGPVTFTVRRR
jgi:hypothetical protein